MIQAGKRKERQNELVYNTSESSRSNKSFYSNPILRLPYWVAASMYNKGAVLLETVLQRLFSQP
jgi:hypothetical protein